MAFNLVALVVNHGPREASAKLVLIILADRANEKAVCFPSRADLMERTGLKASALTVHLRALERDGWLQRKQRFNSSTVFRINVGRLLTLAADREAQRSVPAGFEPFPEEMAQPIENKGDAVKRHTDATKRHTDAAKQHLNLSLNQSSNPAKALILSEKEWTRYQATALPGETRSAWQKRLSSPSGQAH